MLYKLEISETAHGYLVFGTRTVQYSARIFANADLLQGLSMALGAPVDPAALNSGIDGLDEEEDLDKPLISRKAAKVSLPFLYFTRTLRVSISRDRRSACTV